MLHVNHTPTDSDYKQQQVTRYCAASCIGLIVIPLIILMFRKKVFCALSASVFTKTSDCARK